MVEVVAILLHLSPEAVGMAVFDIYPDIDSGLGEMCPDLFAEFGEALALVVPVALDSLLEVGIFVRAAEFETEVLQLRLDVVEAEAGGQRGVEIVGLTGYLHLLVGGHRGEGPHVVETVGEFYENTPYVVAHGVEHLFEIVHLLRHYILLLLPLGDGSDDKGDIVAKEALDLGEGMWRVLDHIVEECGDYGVNVELQLHGGNPRHGDGVEDIGLAGLAALRGMCLAGQLVSLAEALHVGRRSAFTHCLEHFRGPSLYLFIVLVCHGFYI